MFATSVTAGAFTSVDTVLSFDIVFASSPGFVTVTLPSLSTAIWSSFRPGFASLTAFLIAAFSSSVKFAGFLTATFAGSFNSAPGVVSSFSIVSSGPSFPVFVVSPSFTLTVTLPLSSTVIWSSVNPGLTAFTASFTAFCSSSVSFCVSLTLTGLGLFNDNLVSSFTTVSFWDRVPFFSPSVTTTEPSSVTSIFAVSGKFLFASLTAFLTASLSSAVNCSGFCTGVFSGAFNLIILSVSLTCSTVSSSGMLPVFVSPIGTVTAPLLSTWISSSVNPRSGLAALTASLTACFSVSLRLLVSPTLTFSAGGFNVLPSLVNGFTVSFPSNLPVFVPSVTVTLPLLSTITSALLVILFSLAFLTASATSSFSPWLKLAGFFTSTFSVGLFKSSIVSFCTTVLSAGIVPTLPPWLISTVPSGFTVISSSLKFLSGLASFTACLILPISSFVNWPILSTGTGSFGGLKLFWTSFCFTVLSGVKVPVLPSFVTVTVPSSATVTSASVIPLSLFASATAFLTLSISSDVKDLVSLTSTGVGLANSKGVFSVFSQTAYTVFGVSTLSKIPAVGAVASFLSAHPLNVYPSLFGSAGFVTFLFSTFTVVVSLSSPNLPWFASKVTAVSSE